ncbi:hypothetical protein ZWY2020_058054 [Hordeum vulgare]|nr:hypothetical protein ZWY2020_058054 [Hordeum vulgare]
MIHGRHKEDALTFIVSWGGANALLSMSQGRGARAAVSSGLKGAAFGGPLRFLLRLEASVEKTGKLIADAARRLLRNN